MAAGVSVGPIDDPDTGPVSRFLHANLNGGVSPAAWAALLRPPWATGDEPNRGFQLVDGDRIVGVYAAVYSTRPWSSAAVCNLAAFCVLEPYRVQALRLVRAVLGQKGYLFTDLSPSGNVPAMNERLRFRYLDTSTRLLMNLPRPRPGVSVTADRDVLTTTLRDRDAAVYADHHRAPAARHLLVRDGSDHAYLMYRRDRRKRLPLFASPLYVGGDPALLRRSWSAVGAHLLGRGLPATLAEGRVLGFVPRGAGRQLEHPRPKMFRGGDDDEVDYLYSELTLLEW